MITPPELTPVTTPEPLTVAMEGSLLAHVPPPVELDNEMLLPAQTSLGPLIAATKGDGFTVITALPEAAPAHPEASLTAVTA